MTAAGEGSARRDARPPPRPSFAQLLGTAPPAALGLAILGCQPAAAQCVPSGPTLTPGASVACSGTQTTRLGQGPGADNVTVTLNPGATLSTNNTNAISLGNNALITVGSPGGGATATVTTTSTGGGGQYGTGNNTIEFNNNGKIIIYKNGIVSAIGSQNNSEAINPYGSGNTIINYGTIQGGPSSAIFFENINTTASSPRNVVDNYGLITLVGPGNNPITEGQAVGSFGNVGIDFINETGGVVNGNLDLQGGDDHVTLMTGSRITGSLDGGGGNNLLNLDAGPGAYDSLPGNVKNFQTLDKTGPGTWTLTGTIGNNGGAAPLTVNVIGGTLALTGNNANFNGSVFINPGANPSAPGPDPTATLEAPAQSLPPLITDHGVLLVNQADNETYSGLVQGTGVLTKIGAGTLTLAGANTYSGGTNFNGGFIAVAADSALGAATGPLTFSGGGLQLLSSFNLSSGRAITLQSGGGTIDSNGFETTISQAIAGTGGLTVLDSGSLGGAVILTGVNTYTGPTNVNSGTLAIGDAGHPGAALSGAGLVTVSPGATLGGYGAVAGAVVNSGTVAVADALGAFAGGPTGTFTIGGNFANDGTAEIAGSAIGNVLAVKGNYAGGANTVAMINTLLNAGGPLSNQVTDRLLVSGNATGVTSLDVRAFGEGALTTPNVPSANHGISIVQVAGASAVGTFSLSGGYVTGGTPYHYQLYAFGPGSPNGEAAASQNLVGGGSPWDYRLKNVYETPIGPVPPEPPGPPQPPPPDERPEVTPQVPTYLSLPTALFNASLQDLDSVHRRLGEIRDDPGVGRPEDGEVFVRSYGNAFRYTTERSFSDFGYNSTQDYGAVQAGANAIVRHDLNGTLRAGLFGTVGELWLQPYAVDGASSGRFNTYALAGALTWQSAAGWYVDAILSGGANYGGITTALRGRAANSASTAWSASIETGYPFALGWQDLVLEPQLQLIGQRLDFAPFIDADGIAADLGTQSQGVFRAGARLLKPFASTDSGVFTAYLKANVLEGLGGGGTVKLAGDPFQTGTYGTAVQVGGGVSGALSHNLTAYGDVAWQNNVSTGGFRGWAFNGGVRYAF